MRIKYISCVLILSLVGALICSCSSKGAVESNKQPLPMKIGIVDFSKLIKEHADNAQLEALDKKLAAFEQSMYDTPTVMQKMGMEQVNRMQSARQAAEAELKREMANISATLERERAALESQMKEELRKTEAEMKVLREKAKNDAGSEPALKSDVKSYSQSLREFSRDLLVLRDRQLTAKRLELQKQAKERIEVEKSRIEGELSSYEQQIAKENQQEKLNIQLKLQVNKDDQETVHLREELSRISEEESKLKEKKKAEVAAEIEKIGNTEMARIDKEIKAYQSKLDSDIRKQLNARGANIGGGTQDTGGSSGNKYQNQGMNLARQFEAKKNALQGRLMGIQEESRRRFDIKRKALESQLKAQEKIILGEMTKSGSKFQKDEQARMEKKKLDYEKMQSEREKMYNNIVSDIKEKVTEIAKAENIPFVVGSYIANVKGIDLTSKAIEKIRQSRK